MVSEVREEGIKETSCQTGAGSGLSLPGQEVFYRADVFQRADFHCVSWRCFRVAVS